MTFGKRLVKEGYIPGREPAGKRRTWLGIKLVAEYYNAAYAFYEEQTNLRSSLIRQGSVIDESLQFTPFWQR